MVLDFDIAGVSVAGVKLPLESSVFKEFQNLLPVSLSSAAQVRKEDYVAGRMCAFRASSLLGLQLTQLPTNTDRSPQWPSSLCGSISHSKKIAVSCVGRSTDFNSLGIDAEEIIGDEIDVRQQVATTNELELISSNLELTILFSAKEALYKAIYPVVKNFVDFKEVEIEKIDLENKTFLIKALSEQLLNLGLRRFEGHFQIIENTVITLVIIKNKGSYAYP